jgi:2-iminobutanoate/2-iminopropanoate deaminase
MIAISTPDSPQPAGHYSQAIVHAGIVYVSGQLAVDPATGEKRLGSIEVQTEQALRNVAAILEAAGSDLAHVLKTTVYVADISLWGRVNAVYARFFGEHRPARAVVPTKELHYGFLIEIDAIAAVREGTTKDGRLTTGDG